jgi:hypothetical protein
MKVLTSLIVMIVFFSCKQETKATFLSDDYKNEIPTEDCINPSEVEIESPSVIITNIHDCTFDQETQTDEFLKGIKDLEVYTWDVETKTAEIVLNDHWGLTIKRGGCDHFEMYASFVYDRILDIEKEGDRKQIFDNIIWITSLLEDFDGEDIKRVIEENEISITKRDEFNYHANFMDEKLYELYYFDFNNKDKTTFKIGYYYN